MSAIETGVRLKRKLCPKKLCQLRGSPQEVVNNFRTKLAKYHAKP
jgi:hypothetical protein